MRLKCRSIAFPTANLHGRCRPIRPFLAPQKHAVDLTKLQRVKDVRRWIHDTQSPLNLPEHVVVLQDNPDASRTDVIDVGEINVDMMLPAANCRFDSRTQVLSPISVKTPVELQYVSPIMRESSIY